LLKLTEEGGKVLRSKGEADSGSGAIMLRVAPVDREPFEHIAHLLQSTSAIMEA
jgi:hypothetical protein